MVNGGGGDWWWWWWWWWWWCSCSCCVPTVYSIYLELTTNSEAFACVRVNIVDVVVVVTAKIVFHATSRVDEEVVMRVVVCTEKVG
jgi:hypothetical protein